MLTADLSDMKTKDLQLLNPQKMSKNKSASPQKTNSSTHHPAVKFVSIKADSGLATLAPKQIVAKT